jgi:hypothetical protein
VTLELLSPKAIAAYLNVDTSRIRTLRRTGRFPLADARIRNRLGWSKFRLDRFAVETWEWHEPEGHAERVATADAAGVPDGHAPKDGTPLWWLVEPARYLGIPDLAAAAGLQAPALWSHYYKGKLTDPDITIGYHNRIAGWSPASARQLAADQGWDFDLARLPDTSGLGGEL